jgi:hypothetical protein
MNNNLLGGTPGEVKKKTFSPPDSVSKVNSKMMQFNFNEEG